MCGRFASYLPTDALRDLFKTVGGIPNIAPSWNVAPTQQALAVRRHPETGERHLDLLRWGLIPFFNKDPKGGRRPINARMETVATSGMFRSALASRRAIIPADLYYEWQAMPDGKQPYAIARVDGAPLAFAGIWEGWKDPAGEVVRSFAIIPCAATGAMTELHERQPVVLDEADWPVGLGAEEGDRMALLRAVPEHTLHWWPVSRAVNSVRNNNLALIEPLNDPDAPPPSSAPPGQNPA